MGATILHAKYGKRQIWVIGYASFVMLSPKSQLGILGIVVNTILYAVGPSHAVPPATSIVVLTAQKDVFTRLATGLFLIHTFNRDFMSYRKKPWPSEKSNGQAVTLIDSRMNWTICCMVEYVGRIEIREFRVTHFIG